MAEEQQPELEQLRVDSDKLMDALEDMKRTEARKRAEDVSTPAFHELANQVDAKSRRVFDLAHGEKDEADGMETTGQTIDETPPDGG
jgi:hypothetical protein